MCIRDSHDAVLEIPAGKIDKGETDPLKAAVRELKEETGYTAEHIQFLGKINPSVAYSEEVIYLYGMTDLTPGEQDLDEDCLLYTSRRLSCCLPAW